MIRKERMFKIFAIFCAFVQFGTVSFAQPQRKGDDRGTTADVKKEQVGGKPSIIIVADAASNASWTKEITEAELESALVQSGRFTALSRSALDAILNEQKLAQSDLADPTKAVEVGKLLTARYIVIGKCVSAEKKDQEGGLNTRFGNFGSKKSEMNVAVQIQLLDVKTGQIVYAPPTFTDKVKVESSTGSAQGISGGGKKELAAETTYREMMKKFSAKFVGGITIPVEALVVLVKGNQVAIDAGELAAVKPGMEFEVYSEGEPIKNAAGEVLSYDRTVYGKIRIVRVEPKLAWGEIVQTFSDSGQADSAPKTDRIKRDYAVKQTSN